MKLQHERQQFACAPLGARVRRVLERRGQRLDFGVERLGIDFGHRLYRRFSIVGECRCSITRVFPRYICTPHGRHGSKLRTVRMMSIPLKVS